MLEFEIIRSTGFTIGGLAGFAIVALGFQGRSVAEMRETCRSRTRYAKTWTHEGWILLNALLNGFGCDLKEKKGWTSLELSIFAHPGELAKAEIKLKKFVSESDLEEVTQIMTRYEATQTESYIYKEKMQ